MKDWEKWYHGLNDRQRLGYRYMYPDLTYQQMYTRMINRFGYILKPVEVILSSERKELIKRPDVNPITERKIKPDGKTYKKLIKMIVYDK